MSRRILIVGCTGQVGWELMRALRPLGNVIGVDQGLEPYSIDLSNPDSIRACVTEVSPHLVVNAAAYTAVDQAEDQEELAMAVNGTAPGILTEETKRLGSAIVHYSTDYVFDGTQGEPYAEVDAPNPLSAYGRTKLAGDVAVQSAGAPHLILRTSWVYGLRGRNFLRTILRLAGEGKDLRIVDDQIGGPTWCRPLAEATACILAHLHVCTESIAEHQGVYHVSASGETSWWGFAKEILRLTQMDGSRESSKLEAIPTEAYPLPAPRPSYSVLAHDKVQSIFGIHMTPWEVGLRLCLESLDGAQ